MNIHGRWWTGALLLSILAILGLCMALSDGTEDNASAEPQLRPVIVGVERTFSVDTRRAKEVGEQEWIAICRGCEQSQDVFLLEAGAVQYKSGDLTAGFWLKDKKSYEDFAGAAEKIVKSIIERASNQRLIISFHADEAGCIDLAFFIADRGIADGKAVGIHLVSAAYYGFLTKYVAARAPMGMRAYADSIHWHMKRLVGCTQGYYASAMTENALPAKGQPALDGEFSFQIHEEGFAIKRCDRISPEAKPAWECAQKICKLAMGINGMAQAPSMSTEVKRAYQQFEQAVHDYEKIVKRQYWEWGGSV